MKKLLLSLIVAIMLVPTSVKADEGMWFLMFIERLNHRDMEKMGLQLTSEEIYSINHHSLKDAIVQFNGGCTAEMISKDGLVLTNHHCGYDAIAELSSAEKNYLKDGYWAGSRKEEMKPSSLFVRFFVRMDDVSKRILSKVNDQMTELEREKAINQEIAVIEKENNEGGKYTVSVRSFFQGNEYYYFVYQDYKDVRLVGTPPESLGKFGGDTDNWEWPRHTADFSMFRVYADANGNPAEYSPNNVPLQPKHYLPVNIGGVKENDYAMILGYPGRTNRWMPASGIEQNVKFAYPAWVEASKVGMDNMKKYMDQSEALNLVYASKYAGVANYWKNRQGMIDALTKFGTAKTKTAQEAKFNTWANQPENKAKYGNVVATINNFYKLTNEKARHDNYLNILFRTSAMAPVGRTIGKQLENYVKADVAKRAQMAPAIMEMADEFFKEIHIPAEKDILAAQLHLYATKSTGYAIAPLVQKMGAANGNDFARDVNTIIDGSIFASKEKIKSFLDMPSAEVLEKDPLYVLSNDMLKHLVSKSDEVAKAQNDYGAAFRKLVEGLRESKIGEIKYPDANSTLRLTYGKVRSLPADKRNDAKINNYTTLQGQVKKYKKGDQEFDLPARVLEMNKNKEFGRFGDKDGSLHVNFLTDNDITGGNSGSPVLNGKGELIGLAFDGNIEAMAGDVIFDKKLQRTINVDIRYVLWVIENFSNAKHIVDEMTLIK
ncbi:S46 family peptidase [Flavobacterium humi]|uniref:Dipeptidyl-peptidase n=1 Tax=Flavobacterium humi TaxID=2562683 RepID=A0A4Z0L7C7_9FLAO|nr:S46 family peptidase [Flavobacterium humi]TGD57066.1 S46 family peptidase [Flavobacterium humi]